MVVVPDVISGESGRYGHLDMAANQAAMSPEDYRCFVSFVGADAFGLSEDDLAKLKAP